MVRGELYSAHGGRGGAVCRPRSASGALCGCCGLKAGCGDPCVKAGDRCDDEALRLLLLGFLEGPVFRVPMDQEFFHIGGSHVVFDAARCASR